MKVIKLMLVCAAALFVVASVAQADPTEDDFYVVLNGLNDLLDGGGSGYNDGAWYYYPSGWWNEWFYDDPLDPDRWKLITYDMIITPDFLSPNFGPLWVEVAINWSDDTYSNPAEPPMIDPNIVRQIVFSDWVEPAQPVPVSGEITIQDYNPEWVSIDVRVIGYLGEPMDTVSIEGEIWHECLGEDLEYEFGDAPEDCPIAYPTLGLPGWFPTCINTGYLSWIQHGTQLIWFGPTADLETNGNAGTCPYPNCFPPYDQDECFADGDAGLLFPEAYTIIGPAGLESVVPCPQSTGTALGNTCQTATWGVDIDIDVTNGYMASYDVAYVNVLMDWNHSGEWSDTSTCSNPGDAPEHVLVDYQIPAMYSGPLSQVNVSDPAFPPPPPFLIGPEEGYVWTRFTVTHIPIGDPNWNGEGTFFFDGETEDYLLEIEEEEEPEYEFGDAPEGDAANPVVAYPSLGGAPGLFPTCVNVGPAMYIAHNSAYDYGGYFGPTLDFETDGNAGLCPVVAGGGGCFPPYDVDECFGDGDAGLTMPDSYTIAGGVEVLCPGTVSAKPTLGQPCQMAVWGVDIDIDITEVGDGIGSVVNVLADWNQSGEWSGASDCSAVGDTPEHILVNFYIPDGYSGLLSNVPTPPPPFRIGPNPGFVWFRFTTTDEMEPVPDGWIGEGYFSYGGETEDYLLKVEEEQEILYKWSQPPVLNPDTQCYWGWDDPSIYGDDIPFMHPIDADDWLCENGLPVTDIHWWGSYEGWEVPDPPLPPFAPIGFHIGIWTDVPIGADPNPNVIWSHPGRLIWEWWPTMAEVNERPDGCDFYPFEPAFMEFPDACFKYDFQIPQEQWFWQEGPDTIYWLSIAAIYPDPFVFEYPWGWKTREYYFNDAAVRILIPDAPDLGAGIDTYIDGYPIIHEDVWWDLAFELTTQECVKPTAAFYNEWLGIGKNWDRPRCWCYERNCRGDCDGIKIGMFWVQTNDLAIFASSFAKPDGAQTQLSICGDIDHKKVGMFRCQTADLSIFAAYFAKPQAQVPVCPLDWDTPPDGNDDYNFWTN